MRRLVVDASVAVKWVVQEEGSEDAVALIAAAGLCAPDLLVAECANILWKKVRRGELTADEAGMASRLLARADVELLPMRVLLEPSAQLAIELDHPAYDCIYLSLAIALDLRFVTADRRFLQSIRERRPALADTAVALEDAARLEAG